ncbi:MFS transporter [Devosia nitrariae]|uniref:MFS transporter n=1 Tax=Devosia nitrariae TaxID=2071872 RepID=A0ABQ5VZJ1_9HYPH|nr:MFS transporter [Devosia nitrariae]GLQ52868.1 MFS transporter [Devosia nitrariae]
MSLPLLTLFFAAFALGTAEFVIAGVLPEVALGLDVSIPVAGMLVTGYAVGIAAGGPLLALATSAVSRKTLIVWLCGVFTAGQVLCALAPNFELLLVARVLVAIVHGTYFGIAAVVAVNLVPPEKRGFAVALLLAGLTVSNILGVPGGTAIGNALGWRATFWSIATLGLIATIAIAFVLPKAGGRGSSAGRFLSELKVLGRQQVLLSLLVAFLVMIGQYSLFTYIAPLLREVTGLAQDAVPWMLLLFGLGATVGVMIGGRLADWKLLPSLVAILAAQGLMYFLVYVVSPYPIAFAVVAFVWGGTNFAFGSPLQSRILQWAADAPNLASTLIPSAFNVGIAIGAALGAGLIDADIGYRNLPWIGVACQVLAVGVAVTSALWEKRARQVPPMAQQPMAAE